VLNVTIKYYSLSYIKKFLQTNIFLAKIIVDLNIWWTSTNTCKSLWKGYQDHLQYTTWVLYINNKFVQYHHVLIIQFIHIFIFFFWKRSKIVDIIWLRWGYDSTLTGSKYFYKEILYPVPFEKALIYICIRIFVILFLIYDIYN
jgi:hypothetical protein